MRDVSFEALADRKYVESARITSHAGTGLLSAARPTLTRVSSTRRTRACSLLGRRLDKSRHTESAADCAATDETRVALPPSMDRSCLPPEPPPQSAMTRRNNSCT